MNTKLSLRYRGRGRPKVSKEPLDRGTPEMIRKRYKLSLIFGRAQVPPEMISKIQDGSALHLLRALDLITEDQLRTGILFSIIRRRVFQSQGIDPILHSKFSKEETFSFLGVCESDEILEGKWRIVEGALKSTVPSGKPPLRLLDDLVFFHKKDFENVLKQAKAVGMALDCFGAVWRSIGLMPDSNLTR